MAFCTNCGKEISDRAVACPQCGQPQSSAAAWAHQAGVAVHGIATDANAALQKTEGRAIASLILSIASFVLGPGGIVTSILAIIFGNQARRTIRQSPGLQGDGLALAGIIIAWVWVALAILVVLFVILISSSRFRF